MGEVREILSRGKRLDNGEWVEGYYCFMRKRRGVFGQTITELELGTHYIVTMDGKSYPVIPETVGRYIVLIDENGKNIFTGDKFVPFYITPMGERTKELDYDNAGVVKSGTAEFVLERKFLPDISMKSFVDMEFIQYLPNYGEVYKYKDNIAHGIVICNIYDKPELLQDGNK